MTFITNQMIWEKLENLENIFRFGSDKKLKEELQEFPLYQAAKILGIGEKKLRDLAIENKIDCMIEDKSNGKDGITFRFTAKQIKDYQQKRLYVPVKENLSSSEIDKIINGSF
ncbi:MAG: hypothetical protein HYS24_12960 [Ignavibacteriales bacterium]|nr:hypothetical protein [Ignavibacteriales bacterium]